MGSRRSALQARINRRAAVAGDHDPRWQRGWCRDGQPSSKHPLKRGPVSQAGSHSSLFDCSWIGCRDSKRLDVAAVPLPASWCAHCRRGLLQTPLHQEGRLHSPRRFPPDKSQRSSERLAPSLSPHGPPPRFGFATKTTASSRRSRIHPEPARPRNAPVVHRASSATHRLSASATRCHPGTPPIRPTPTAPQQAARASDGSTVIEGAGQAFSGQGSVGRACCVTPTRATARPGGFTPT